MRRLLLAALVLLLPLGTASAQEAPSMPSLTWVRYYTVAPGKDADFFRFLHGPSRKVYDRLMAAKKIANWGVAVPLSHNPTTWTHLVYISAPDWSGFDALVAEAEKNMAALSDAEKKQFAEGFAATIAPNGIHDVVLRHVVQAQAPPPPEMKLRYLVVNEHPIKARRGIDAVELFNEWPKPIFTDLAAKGKVGPWGLSVQDIVVNEGPTYIVWYFVPALASLDDVTTSLGALDPAKLRSYWLRLDDMSEHQYRGQILRIVDSAP